jgi:hypothetical protein
MDKMKWDLQTIGMVTAIFFLGYIIGLVEAAIKQNIKNKKKAIVEEKETSESVETPVAAVKEPNLLSINRSPGKQLVVEVEGLTYAKKEELTPDQKNKVINLLVELRPWVENAPTAQPEKVETEPEQTRQTEVKPAVKPTPATGLKITSPTKVILPVKPVRSIVSQIDEVLQTRLASSPLASRGIRLVESETGGVLVYIGLDKYEGIDTIPDPEIQAFIRQSVAIWEKQS